MNPAQPGNNANDPKNFDWKAAIAKYQVPHVLRSSWQLLDTLIPYGLVWYLMVLSLKVSYWLTLPLTILAGLLLVRIFIIFHDCGHGSFFKSRIANRFWGFVTGILVFTPHQDWWRKHAQHHATAGDLDERGIGDMWTLTIEEYLKASRWTRIKYRFARNPFCLFIIGPLILFLVFHRIPRRKSDPKEQKSVVLTNIGILFMAIGMSYLIGLKEYLLIQLPVLMISASLGVWMFYVQHQFEGVYWERHPKWDYLTEAMQGSSFYKLPKVLQWFTGNIGYHHIHHLSPRIPNYYLEKCYRENPLFHIKPVTFLGSLKALKFRLWDEKNHRLVGFGYLKKLKLPGRKSNHKSESNPPAKN